MALHFDSPGTSLIVRQYLERSRKILRSDLSEKTQLLFSQEGAEERNGQHNEEGEKTTEPPTPKMLVVLPNLPMKAHTTSLTMKKS
jgi:hypothetical protein